MRVQALEKAHSDEAEVAGMARKSCAIFANHGNDRSFRHHQSIGPNAPPGLAVAKSSSSSFGSSGSIASMISLMLGSKGAEASDVDWLVVWLPFMGWS